MNTNLFLDLDGPSFSPFAAIREYSWLRFLFLKSILSVTSQVLRLPLRRSLFLLAPQVKEQRQQSSQRQASEDSQHAHHDQTVCPTIRVVHITVKDDLIG